MRLEALDRYSHTAIFPGWKEHTRFRCSRNKKMYEHHHTLLSRHRFIRRPLLHGFAAGAEISPSAPGSSVIAAGGFSG